MSVYLNKYCFQGKSYTSQEIQDQLALINGLDPTTSSAVLSAIIGVISKNRIDSIQNRALPTSSLLSRAQVINDDYQYNEADIEQSKLFLFKIKECARLNFDVALESVTNKVINSFNFLFKKHQLLPRIYFPLLDTEHEEYPINLFQSQLTEDAKYLGANLVEISTDCQMPRTLYHFFYIYFALKRGNNPTQDFILTAPVRVNEPEYLMLDWCEENYVATVEQLHADILEFLREEDLIAANLRWKEVKDIVNKICEDFKDIYLIKPYLKHNLWSYFFKLCFNEGVEFSRFKTTLLQAIALEWGAPASTEILYRAARLAEDHPIHQKYGNSRSLSFGSSLLSGLVFEGEICGTCPYVYYTWSSYNSSKNEQLISNSLKDSTQLYALKLQPQEVQSYFLCPTIFKNRPLLPLFAGNEFSHPRLRFFLDETGNPVKGISSSPANQNAILRYGQFFPTAEINDKASYCKKISEIFQKNIVLLGHTAVVKPENSDLFFTNKSINFYLSGIRDQDSEFMSWYDLGDSCLYYINIFKEDFLDWGLCRSVNEFIKNNNQIEIKDDFFDSQLFMFRSVDDISFVVVIQEASGELKTFVIDSSNIDFFKNKLSQDDGSSLRKICIYNLDKNNIEKCSHQKMTEEQLHANPIFMTHLVQLKLLRQNVAYSSIELMYVEQWIRVQGARRIYELFSQICVSENAHRHLFFDTIGQMFKKLLIEESKTEGRSRLAQKRVWPDEDDPAIKCSVGLQNVGMMINAFT